jgi:hypothetical protein
MEDNGILVPGENHRPAASYWQTLSHNIESSTLHLSRIRTHNASGDRHWLYTTCKNMNHSSVQHEPFLCSTWTIPLFNMNHSSVQHEPFLWSTWTIPLFNMNHSSVQHILFCNLQSRAWTGSRRIGDSLVWVVRESNYLTHWATRARQSYLRDWIFPLHHSRIIFPCWKMDCI